LNTRRTANLLQALDDASRPEEMNLPSFRFHALVGQDRGRYKPFAIVPMERQAESIKIESTARANSLGTRVTTADYTQLGGWNVPHLLTRFFKDQTGATAIEYGLIAAGIAVVIIAVVQGVGTSLVTTFTSVQTALK
jgi:pilus assembly protein Flp/PilA